MNLELWNSWKQPPVKNLKNFDNGTYKGTDISPQWRYQILTETFGAIGFGWYYTIDRLWTENGSDGQVVALANISLFIKKDDEWSRAIPGTGGNILINRFKNKYAKENEEPYYLKTSDEGFKMAVTDALSVACKMLGIGADIYLGNFDGSKYKDTEPQKPVKKPVKKPVEIIIDYIQKNQDKKAESLKHFESIKHLYTAEEIKKVMEA